MAAARAKRKRRRWRDEDPSAEDVARFGDDGSQTGWCPDCAEEVWDEAESCPACGALIGGRILRRPPAAQAFQRRLTIVVTIVVLVVFILVFAI
jgi:hypothetical protein